MNTCDITFRDRRLLSSIYMKARKNHLLIDWERISPSCKSLSSLKSLPSSPFPIFVDFVSSTRLPDFTRCNGVLFDILPDVTRTILSLTGSQFQLILFQFSFIYVLNNWNWLHYLYQPKPFGSNIPSLNQPSNAILISSNCVTNNRVLDVSAP